MASPIQWTWVWVNSGSWWWTGRAGVLQSMVLQRVGHGWATKLNWTEHDFGHILKLQNICVRENPHNGVLKLKHYASISNKQYLFMRTSSFFFRESLYPLINTFIFCSDLRWKVNRIMGKYLVHQLSQFIILYHWEVLVDAFSKFFKNFM